MTGRFCGSARANAERVRSLEETQENSSGQRTSEKKKKEEVSVSNLQQKPRFFLATFLL
jgi:hypothetical protein